MNRKLLFTLLITIAVLYSFKVVREWQSKFASVNKDGSINYTADEKGNTLPDFSRVGYYAGDKNIPNVAVVKTIVPSDDAEKQIQTAID